MSIKDNDIRKFLLSKRTFNRQPFLFSHTIGYLNSRFVNFRRLLLVLVIDMGIINTCKLQDPQRQYVERERKRITTLEKAIKIGEKKLKKNYDFYFKATSLVLDNKDGFFYINTRAFDRFITDIVGPLINMIKYI
jgi:hypothetical protein